MSLHEAEPEICKFGGCGSAMNCLSPVGWQTRKPIYTKISETYVQRREMLPAFLQQLHSWLWVLWVALGSLTINCFGGLKLTHKSFCYLQLFYLEGHH